MGRIRIVEEYEPKVRQIHYHVDEFEKSDILICDNASVAEKGYQVIGLPEASKEMLKYIGWGEKTKDNIVEQGGLLVGYNGYDAEKSLNICMIEVVFPAKQAVGSWGFLEIGHENIKEIYDKLDEINEQYSEEEKRVVVGWFHTHPNSLDVFMSGTDRGTQSRLFAGEKAIALVLNPQKKIWKCYRAKQCLDTKAQLLLGEEMEQQFGKDSLLNEKL